MALEYTNRRGETYFLQEGKTPKGRPKYYMGRKITGTALDEPPEGYEIYESPEQGQVLIRKIVPTEILPCERELVAQGVRRESGIAHVIVDVKANALIVYVPSNSAAVIDETIRDLTRGFPFSDASGIREFMMRRSVYEKRLRFELIDPKRRLFAVERWCFRGSIDDWIYLEGPARLAGLVKKYAKHLGKESFFDLM